jgi:hypothetical protein
MSALRQLRSWDPWRNATPILPTLDQIDVVIGSTLVSDRFERIQLEGKMRYF